MFFSSVIISKLHGYGTKRITIFHRSSHFCSVSASASNSIASLSSRDRSKLLATLLSNCTNLARVRQIHGDIFHSRILDQYQNAFLWNNIMRSYIRHDSPLDSVEVYLGMVKSNVLPDRYTLPIVIKAAVKINDFLMGKQLHSVAMRLGLVGDEFCESGFITLYCKAGEFENALKVFDENPERKLGSWNAIIGGLNHAGRVNEAVEMFMEMKRNGFEPNDYTMVSVTSSCGGLGDLSLALQLHKCVLQAKTEEKSDIMMMNSLIDMYGKCGRIDLATQVFDEMRQRNVISYSSMITIYAANGNTSEALDYFHQMRDLGIKPNKITFLGVLSACVHGGLVEEGKAYFASMKSEFELEPDLSHYGCIVDLLSRDGQLKEAKKVVEEMPMKPNVMVWGCLMGGCEKYGDVEMAEWVAQHMVELEPWNDGVYVVLANVYAVRGMWKDVDRVRGLMKEKRLVKVPAFSYASTTGF